MTTLPDATPLAWLPEPITTFPEAVPLAWRLWEFTWKSPTAGKHTLMARATDSRGNVQPRERFPPPQHLDGQGVSLVPPEAPAEGIVERRIVDGNAAQGDQPVALLDTGL